MKLEQLPRTGPALAPKIRKDLLSSECHWEVEVSDCVNSSDSA